MSTNEDNWAIIVAAGKGLRMKNPLPKQFLIWRQRPLYWHSALAFARCCCVNGIIFVFPQDWLNREIKRLERLQRLDRPGIKWLAIAGGERRQDSARMGLESLPSNCKKVFIHDAARPFLKAELIHRLDMALTGDYAGIIPVLPVTDTIKVLNGNDEICATPDRSSLVAVQTPQVFWANILKDYQGQTGDVTDDASLLEKAGKRIGIVDGMNDNIKITTAADLELLNGKEKELPCSGFGYDAHRLGGNRPLKIGGVDIPGDYAVFAHSDGDVLMHALIDALLGCAALGDIGMHFPDSEPALDGISSAIMLDDVLQKISLAGVRICHVDLTFVAQKPRLAPWRDAIRKNLARLLGLSLGNVNFKATTEEGMGFTGNGEGIKAYALVSGMKMQKIGTEAI